MQMIYYHAILYESFTKLSNFTHQLISFEENLMQLIFQEIEYSLLTKKF